MKDQFVDANFRSCFVPADGNKEPKVAEQYRTKRIVPKSTATTEDSDPGKASTMSTEREHTVSAA